MTTATRWTAGGCELLLADLPVITWRHGRIADLVGSARPRQQTALVGRVVRAARSARCPCVRYRPDRDGIVASAMQVVA